MNRPFILALIAMLTLNLYAQPESGQAGFYGFNDGPAECISNAERNLIEAYIQQNREALKSSGALNKTGTATNVLFDWPMQLDPSISDYGYYYFSGYVNHDSTNSPLDYNCGHASFYNPASNQYHRGTDIGVWPFKWLKMDDNLVHIIAAAEGTIVGKTDGRFDRSCSFNSNTWNAVYIQHADGSVAWYGHLKMGSVTSKPIGSTVVAGEYLGIIGSSGNSSGVHLHFEVHDAQNRIIDPFSGPCNNNASWWNNQKAYLEPGINHVATNAHLPILPACPNQETTNETDYFFSGDTLFVMGYFRGINPQDSITHRIYYPNGALWKNYPYVHTQSFYSTGYYWVWQILDAAKPAGKWKYEVTYKGQKGEHYFYFNTGTGVNDDENDDNFFKLYPNPANNTLNVEIKNTAMANVNINLYDQTGRLLLQHKTDNINTLLDLQPYAAGIYYVQLQAGEVDVRRKVVMMK